MAAREIACACSARACGTPREHFFSGQLAPLGVMLKKINARNGHVRILGLQVT